MKEVCVGGVGRGIFVRRFALRLDLGKCPLVLCVGVS